MSIDCLSLDDAHEYHEWSYTTARGETVSVYSGNHQFIVLYNGENAFISLVSQPGDSLGDDEIKAYVLEKYGLKVSSLYISQVKRKCGMDVGQNYNLSKKEDAKVPQCPPEKEAAIMDALKHFQMI